MNTMSYHDTVKDVYRKAARQPDVSLCCVPQSQRHLPGLVIPPIMHQMNYGCGTTVHLQDMQPNQTVVYVGVGGGLEALQFAYFTRRPGGVVAVDPVAEMREAARQNLAAAAKVNDWFDPSFVDIRDGDALDLPLENECADLAAQNCLFNIFKTAEDGRDFEQALAEMHRLLKRGGRLTMSDPITTRPIPAHLKNNEVLRAQCLSGCLTFERYVRTIVAAGFGSVGIRSRRPYRVLDKAGFKLEADLLLETIEVCAIRSPIPDDGPCIFTGRYAVYSGTEEQFDDGTGHVLPRGLPVAVCDKTAGALAALKRMDIMLTPSTWHYDGGGCC